MDWNLKSHLDWVWNNNNNNTISMSSCAELDICTHAEPSIHEKKVNKAADNSRQIFSLHADGFSGYSLEHGSTMKDEEYYYGKEKRKEKNPASEESLIGLNLYPANNETVTNYPILPLSSSTTKRYRGSYHLMQNPCCQVEGCNLDLTSAKEYHRRHRICEAHSKTPTVIVAGMLRRFCQQCSRFHDLSEFDNKKRSCRRRLSDHNARRRRQPEANHFSSTGRSSSFHDGQSRTSSCLSGSSMSTSNSMGKSSCRLKTIDGLNGSRSHSNLAVASDLPHAHSLLSTNSLCLNDPTPTSMEQLMHEAQPFVHSVTPNWRVPSEPLSAAQQVPFYTPHGFNGSA